MLYEYVNEKGILKKEHRFCIGVGWFFPLVLKRVSLKWASCICCLSASLKIIKKVICVIEKFNLVTEVDH